MYRIAAAQISHETNVFSSVRTDLAAFARSGISRGSAIIVRERDTNSAFGGFIDGAGQHGFTLIPIVSVWATPSGMVTAEAIKTLVSELVSAIHFAKPDGVLLGLHGAMVTELDDDGDGYILESVRSEVGPDIPIIATLDLHATITDRMLRAATALIGYDTYPHVDMRERAREASDLMMRVLAGDARPTARSVRPPMVPTSQNMVTDREPMKSLIALAHEMERNPRVLNVTVCGGFPPSDVYDTGFAALVTTDDDPDLANRLAYQLATAAWNSRNGFLGGVTSFEDAAAIMSAQLPHPDRPIVLVDIGDNPWSGSPGDSAELVSFLLDQRIERAAVAMVVDPVAVQQCIAAGVGAAIELEIGGKTDTLHGPPLPIHGYVRLIGDGRYVNAGPMMAGLDVDLGTTVVLVASDGRLEILLTSHAETPIDLNVFRAHGIEPTQRRVIGLKGKGHFRAAFEPIADQVILVEGPGISGSDFSRLPFRNIRRPIWPLDEGVTFD